MNLPIHLPLKMDDEKMFEVFEVPTTLVDTVFHLSKESIGNLKAKENTEMGVKSVFSLQAFLAHLWHAITRCRKHDAEEEVVINIIVGTRSRLNPPHPEGYFGNAIHYKNVKTSAMELLENGLGWAATQINKMVVAQNSEEVVKVYKDWDENPILITKGSVYGGITKLAIGSSPRRSVDIEVCLLPETLQALENDKEFMVAVTNT
ncbi:putative trihelix transcription factor GT-3b-like [Capsicum annuum]|nr:putative trihelix transcription factor GT-3b-like [Capsicum annuum]